jgi:hypothetical protein
MDWKRELVIAQLVKQKIPEVDVDQLWENTLPEVAASEAQLHALEERLDHPLDPQYRAFLLHANGWRAFMQYMDVFGVGDFEGCPRAERANELIASLEPIAPICGFSSEDLMPIAVSSLDIDVMLMTRPHSATPGKIFWFAGGLIDSFTGFDDWFLAMVDYNRQEYQRLVGDVNA